VGHVTYMGEMRNAYRIFVGKPEGNKLRRTSEGNININLKEVECDVTNRTYLAQDIDR
jgi:hypothetical protein